MPLVFERTFRVRNYECDLIGHLNSVNYLRFMQETAFDASSDAGYQKSRYSEMNRLWLIRESEVEYIQPIYYEDRVQVRTWIADFRRVSSRRLYEFRIEGREEVSARGFSDWVFLNAETQVPVSIPGDFRQVFFPEGAPDHFPIRQPFPKPPEPPKGVFTSRRRVDWQDIDPLGHVNNAVYMAYANECGFEAIKAFGWPWERMKAEGCAILLRKCQIQYLQPAFFDEELEIATWVSNVQRSSAVRHYTIRRASDQTLLCQTNMLGVWVNLKTGRPARFSAEFLKDFEPNTAPSAQFDHAAAGGVQ